MCKSKNTKTLRTELNKYTSAKLKFLIHQQPRLIRFINEPSEELQLIAILQNYKCYNYIENPTEKAKSMFLYLRNKTKSERKSKSVIVA